VKSHDWTGVLPALHAFCATDLSAFYFDVRKDALYCDRPDSIRRRAARTVLDHLQRCLTLWLAPILVFTAEEAWTARFGEGESVHLQRTPDLPGEWADPALGARIEALRDVRRTVTAAIERMRAEGAIGSSLQTTAVIGPEAPALGAAGWAELCITSSATLAGETTAAIAPGDKCARCWRVLPEVGSLPDHPALCRRCADAVASGLVCEVAA
jgi:isoleucyl-tRNA synthetase